MATDLASAQTEINSSASELSNAQKLMLKHDASHNPTVEEVPDEEDVIKHGEAPQSKSIIEGPDDIPEAPTWTPPISAKTAGKQKAAEPSQKENTPILDTQSHDLFPELGGPTKSAAPSFASTWGAKKPASVSTNGSNGLDGTANGSAPPTNSAPTSGAATPTSTTAAAPRGGPTNFSIPGRQVERISLSPQALLTRAQLKKSIPDVLKDINKRSKANVTMSTGNEGMLWFNAVGPTEASRQALKDVVDQIGAKQSIKVQIPRSTRAHIIGKGGSVIKALQEKTGARIQMPKIEDANANFDDDDDDSTIDVAIEGNALTAEMARREVLKIANERTATINHKLRGIPAEFYPFIAGPNNSRVSDLEEGKNLRVHVPAHHTWSQQAPPQPVASGQPVAFIPAAPNNPITLAGDRVAVQEARSQIERHAEELKQKLALEQLAINRGRHQFIIGDRGISSQQFLADTGCAIILPEDSDDETITIIGPAEKLQAAVETAMDLATNMHSTNVDISRQYRNAPGGASAHARDVTRYLQQRKEIERLEKLHDAHIVTPFIPGGVSPWELYSRDGKNTIRAQSEITSIVNGHPPSRMANVNVDPFFYQHLRKDITPKLQQDFGVYTVIPAESESGSPVLLVFEGPSGVESGYQVPRTHPTQTEIKAFQQGLEDARKYILDIISRQEAIKTQSIDVPLKFHEKLRRYIKREQESRPADQIPIRVSVTGTVVTLRGTASLVDGMAEKINNWLAQEIEDEKERGFTLSFDFPQKHANQLIGKGGANIRDLRERFDVEIQVNDGKVELKGPQAKANAAKAHILALGKQWADEATHILKIEPKYHRELIGKEGNQINKLQTRYKVQIHFPRSARPTKDDYSADGASSEIAAPKGGRRPQAEDEVVVKGPSRGADEARDEILSLLQYLKDNSFGATISVQQGQVPSLIGQGGKGMDELRQLTGAKIDIPNNRDTKDASGLVEIQIKGTKSQVTQAKKILEEKKAVFDQSIVKTVEIDKKYHRALIGAGGSTLRDIILKAGGSDDRRELARTVQFPKSEADGNSIKVEGNKAVVEKIIAAMQAIVAEKESQVTETIEVPTDKHRSLIGRGGDIKKELESKFKVTIDIPRQGSGQTSVKISGLPADVENAKAHISEITKQEEGEEVHVPRSYHHAVSDNGQFFRKLKADHKVTVDHAGHQVPPKPSAPTPATNGGALPLITDDQETAAGAHSWHTVSVIPPDLEGEIPWVFRGNPASIAKAKAALAAALEQVKKNTTTGYLVLPDPRTYRFVIGQGGSKVNSIRKQSGCKITVPKSDQAAGEPIEICGSAGGVEKAKDLVLEAVKEGIAGQRS